MLTHHVENLGMKRSTVDPCVLLKRIGPKLEVLVLIQIDDILVFGDTEFPHDEHAASEAFNSKPRSPLTDTSTPFNGVKLRRLSPKHLAAHAEFRDGDHKMNAASPADFKTATAQIVTTDREAEQNDDTHTDTNGQTKTALNDR